MGFLNWLGKHFPSCNEEIMDCDPVEKFQIENPRSCRPIYPSYRQLLNEAAYNARTMEGTIEVGLPRLKSEVVRLREEVRSLRKELQNQPALFERRESVAPDGQGKDA